MTFGEDQKGDQGGGPKNGQNFGRGKNSKILGFLFGQKKVLLTAEKSGVGPKLTKKIGNTDIIKRTAQKMAKIQNGAKPGVLFGERKCCKPFAPDVGKYSALLASVNGNTAKKESRVRKKGRRS